MPRVPSVQGPQVLPGGAGQFVRTPDVSSATRTTAGALNALGESVDRISQREDQDVAWRAQAQINEEWVKFEADARKNARGRGAAGYADQVKGWWAKAATDYAKDLSPSQQALVGRNLMAARNAAYDGALKFEDQELERSRLEALDGALSAEISRGSAGGPSAATTSISIMKDMLQKYAAQSGKPPEWTEAQIRTRSTAVHANVISSLMQNDPKAAQRYFEANKGEIDGARHDEIGFKLNQVNALADGDAKAQELWSTVKPGAPVEIDKLEAEARKAFPNDPARSKAAIDGLRERLTAYDAAERQRVAAGVNAVYKMIDSGAPMSLIRRSPEWESIKGEAQDRILYQQEARAAAREQRAAAAESRAAAAEARRDRQLLISNGDAYMRYSDPEVLAKMTRPEVEAMRSVFGFEGAQHLLGRWDQLQKPGAISEARMDTEDFNHVADQLGLKPYDAKTADAKKALGELKYRVETLINAAQQAKKATLTRDEKAELMRQEMARTVTLSGWFSNSEVPVIQLSPKQLKDVVIPPADKKQIAEALQKKYEATGDARFAPTEENARRLYLMNKSRAAALIPDGQ